MSGRKSTNTIETQVLQFLDDNPGEFLTYEDIARKFDCSIRAAQEASYLLKAQGKVEVLKTVHRLVGSGS